MINKIKQWIANFLFKVKCSAMNIRVASIEDSLQRIISEHVSIVRFGDGELQWICNINQNNFQEYDPKMASELKYVLTSHNEKIMVCVPPIFDEMYNFTERSRFFWKKHMIRYGRLWASLLDDRLYFNAFITRPYMSYNKSRDFECIFDLWKDVFRNRDILIVEGALTRFGVGNDLLEGAKSVARILCPEKNAFRKYDEIYAEVVAFTDRCKDTLVLTALGPTATILSYYLGINNIQSIDIGHLDVEYEWYKLGTTDKVPIKGKYVNEASDKGGAIVDDCDDVEYLGQIVKKI
jgi:glycosyltransferase family protein